MFRVHDDVIKWKQFPRYWPFVRGIHRSPVNSPHKGQWRGALVFSLICVWINGWVNNREAGDLRRYRVHYDVTVMSQLWYSLIPILARLQWTYPAKLLWWYVNVSLLMRMFFRKYPHQYHKFHKNNKCTWYTFVSDIPVNTMVQW